MEQSKRDFFMMEQEIKQDINGQQKTRMEAGKITPKTKELSHAIDQLNDLNFPKKQKARLQSILEKQGPKIFNELINGAVIDTIKAQMSK